MDHPRSRGVYRQQVPDRVGVGGSSPLARGLRLALDKECLIRGIIPARAGFTRRRICGALYCADHPRSRGVYVHQKGSGVRRQGSSPLARGLRIAEGLPNGCAGIIPARAGFTSRFPAGCDDYHGSSPLARGLPVSSMPMRVVGRIIPARAGFTRTPSTIAVFPRDHPRSRGVYPSLYTRVLGDLGSSPLARGLHVWREFVAATPGIIPARAGFTLSPLGPLTRPADHPRSRGVYADEGGGDYVFSGSSPLARGLRAAGLRRVRVRRIIPARAGFTRRNCPRATN